MEEKRTLSTKERALRINLDQSVYGSFAEIGAGQEVAANFFKAGGASGTIAKTMSAYDMSFSDAIYGKHGRYVCEPRLIRMLEKEYDLLPERLPNRISDTRFFAFANTVEALNYEKTNQPHGWIGCRFQLRPDSTPNECVIHVKMNDNDILAQQATIGTIGVNLIFACMYISDPEEFLNSLVDGISKDRIEIDMFRLDGSDFDHVDNRLMSLKLVKNGMTRATMFSPDGSMLQPSEVLYKKNVLVLRGRYRPVTHVNVDMLLAARRHFIPEPDVDKKNIYVLCELTLTDLSKDGQIDEKDFLQRVDIICSLGQNVLISNYPEYYRLVNHLSRLTKGFKIGIILGVYSLQRIFDEKYYTGLRGGILEAFGKLFGGNVKLYVYPSIKIDGGKELLTLNELDIPEEMKSMLQYLKDNNKLEDINNANLDNLDIISDNVLEMISSGNDDWVRYVPKKVVTAIKENELFGYSHKQLPENSNVN
ncbi:MAG: TonB-dependent receptor [Cyclobacteriaceae bacterium]|nr:TonB-dependent receptor [Cyclobacteriaceae bacterium]